MRIALVYPEVVEVARYGEARKEFPTFGVLYLAAVLERDNYDVNVFKISHDCTALDLSSYDIVGFSIPSSATYDLIHKARMDSSLADGATLIAGGLHATLFPEETLQDLDVSVVCLGESEEILPELLETLPSGNIEGVRGICYMRNQIPTLTNPRPPVGHLDGLPFPARHLLSPDDFLMTDRLAETHLKMTHILLSRGCPFSCRFCGGQTKNVRYRSGKSVREELVHLVAKYGVEGFAVTDDNFLVRRSAVKEICAAIQDLGLKWSALSRVDSVDEDLLNCMANSGCIEIKYGIESGSPRILEAMDKRISIEQIFRAVRLTKQAGLSVKAFLIHGFPGENLASTRETIQVLQAIEGDIDRVSLFRFVPLPGSYVFNHPEEYDLHIPRDRNKWNQLHIYHNDRHWWGTAENWEELKAAYKEIHNYLEYKWGQ